MRRGRGRRQRGLVSEGRADHPNRRAGGTAGDGRCDPSSISCERRAPMVTTGMATKHLGSLCNPVDNSPRGSSSQGILQARILEWVVISFSRRSSRPREDLGLAGGFFNR